LKKLIFKRFFPFYAKGRAKFFLCNMLRKPELYPEVGD